MSIVSLSDERRPCGGTLTHVISPVILLMVFLDRSRVILSLLSFLFFSLPFFFSTLLCIASSIARNTRVTREVFFFLQSQELYTFAFSNFFFFLAYASHERELRLRSVFDTPTRGTLCERDYFVAISTKSRKFFLYRS